MTMRRSSEPVPCAHSAARMPSSVTAIPPKVIPRERRARPTSIHHNSQSAASASPALARHPASTSAQFWVCRPAKIGSPRLGWPMVVASVAAPMVHTDAVRIPAMMKGAASGASTR